MQTKAMEKSGPLTRKICTEQDLSGEDKFIHSRQVGSPRTQRGVVVETPEIFKKFFGGEFTAHIMREDGDPGSEKWGTPAQMCKDDFDMGVTTFTASYYEMGCRFECFVWNL